MVCSAASNPWSIKHGRKSIAKQSAVVGTNFRTNQGAVCSPRRSLLATGLASTTSMQERLRL